MAINPITVDLPAGLLAADFSPWSPEARARSRGITGRDLGLLYTEPVIPRYAPEYSWDVSGMPSVSSYIYEKEEPYTRPEIDPSLPPMDSRSDDFDPSTFVEGTPIVHVPKGDEIDIMGSDPVTVTPPVDESGSPTFVTLAEVAPGYIRLDDGSVVPDTSASTSTTSEPVDETPYLFFPDYSAYVDKYPDLAAHYSAGGGGGKSKAEWGREHYDVYGAGEGREPPTYKVFDFVGSGYLP